ncbi:hypothetical protein BBO_09388 [Beauveria brongniartii RCEF 3172]|uniref:Uncharacterized protein n=1 Tax=Beauveria brongniartii RCEF 3172 TaxID=1081107 RepID=A0A166VRA4_9HYPO|nr:hypothetical protein BBO_09388 [Beauveria brongniartii RCEF 3172]
MNPAIDRSGCTKSRTETTTDTPLLRHNGLVYTHPECMRDVPLEKIDRYHPYWEKFWPDLQTLVKQRQQFWMDRYNAGREVDDKSKRYYYNRQVNRGTTILAFLADGKISPFQLLSKPCMTIVGKGSISSYNTLYQLCHTIEELAKFKLDVEPIDWLRLRLHALREEQVPKFNLSRIIADFYHDPELAILRSKSGFKSNGRPLSQTNDNSKIRHVLKRKASLSTATSETSLEAAGWQPDLELKKNECVSKRRNKLECLHNCRALDDLLANDCRANWRELAMRNPSEELTRLTSITQMMADQNQRQELQLCRVKDMELVNQTWLKIHSMVEASTGKQPNRSEFSSLRLPDENLVRLSTEFNFW